jgi:hypothetical protein
MRQILTPETSSALDYEAGNHVKATIAGETPMSLTELKIVWRSFSDLPESTWKSALNQAQWERLHKKFQELRSVGNKD